LGFSECGGFEVVFANDIDQDAGQTFAYNHPGVATYVGDIKKLTKKRVESDIGRSDIDVVVGGPPCQAYSTAGKRLLSDGRAWMFRQYHRILEEFRPKVFLFENVTGLLSMRAKDGGEKLFDHIVGVLGNLGYDVSWKVLDASEHGVPQKRRRVFVVGTRTGAGFEFPPPLSERKLTLRDALGDLPVNAPPRGKRAGYASGPSNAFQESMRRGAPGSILYHSGSSHGESLMKVIRAIPKNGGRAVDAPGTIRPSSGFGNSYARLWWDRPSTTITRNLGTPSSARCIHPEADRALTTREGARLQSFPDRYRFFGTPSSKNLQIGNAVPPVLAGRMAEAVLRHLEGRKNV